MKVFLHTEDVTRLKALLESLEYDGTFELEVDNSSGIGPVVRAHVPQSIKCLQGVFSYDVSSVENW